MWIFFKEKNDLKAMKKFTLMEMMVVLAIIAILLSFLIPGLGRARENARMTQCLNQEKQIAIALMLYTNENKFSYPAGHERYAWDDAISDYLMLDWPEAQRNKLRIDDAQYEKQVLLCPSDDVAPREGKFRRSYAVNAYRDNNAKPGLIFYTDDSTSGAPSMKSTFITKPTRTVLLGEMWDDWNLQGQGEGSSVITGAGYQQLQYDSSGQQYEKYLCHKEKGIANFIYADGSGGSRFGGELLQGAPNQGQSSNFKGSWLDSRQ